MIVMIVIPIRAIERDAKYNMREIVPDIYRTQGPNAVGWKTSNANGNTDDTNTKHNNIIETIANDNCNMLMTIIMSWHICSRLFTSNM